MKKYMIALAAVFAFTANAGLNTAKVNVDPTIVEKRDIHDVDQNGSVDAFDASAILDAWSSNSTETKYDVDKNGSVDAFDASSALDCWVTPCNVKVDKD